MSRRTVPLTVDRLADLPTACASCLVWELDPVRRQRVAADEARGEKEAWVSTVLRDWGSCGRVAVVDDQVAGYVMYAPPAYVPGMALFPTAPVSPDAVLMTALWVHPHHRRGGIGRLLVQGMAKDLLTRGDIRAVEAFADARGVAGRCVVPAEFCGRVGFKTQRAHGTSPRMRMELRSALTWKDEVEQALERLLGAVRPLVHPAPKPSRPAGRGLRSGDQRRARPPRRPRSPRFRSS